MNEKFCAFLKTAPNSEDFRIGRLKGVIEVVKSAFSGSVLQDTFCRYIEKAVDFRDKEHEKAWLIKAATNRCRDIHRQRTRHPRTDLEEVAAYCEMPVQSEVFSNVEAGKREIYHLNWRDFSNRQNYSFQIAVKDGSFVYTARSGRNVEKEVVRIFNAHIYNASAICAAFIHAVLFHLSYHSCMTLESFGTKIRILVIFPHFLSIFAIL